MARDATRPIVVGVDTSPGARRALEWAVDEALLRDCAVRAVVVWSVDVTSEPPWLPAEEIRQRHARELAGTIAEVSRGRARVPEIVPVVLESAPAAGLLEEARGAAMLVVARRAESCVRRALLGSVSSACVKHATVPVVVVPPPSAGPADAEEWPAHDAGATTG
ncbi:universal stress protein [Saccharomonospora piscinae]|uniref:universal stress protein n=1 Tax=Saccharomonospora piscinae TaxID=687388 RepID=UPI0004661647|nr:universal stress protein [Saccharomonospora piscinae]